MACLFTAFLTITNLPTWIDFKPFNCAICLSFWSTLVLVPFTNVSYEGIIAYAGISAYLAIILKRVIFKI